MLAEWREVVMHQIVGLHLGIKVCVSDWQGLEALLLAGCSDHLCSFLSRGRLELEGIQHGLEEAAAPVCKEHTRLQLVSDNSYTIIVDRLHHKAGSKVSGKHQ